MDKDYNLAILAAVGSIIVALGSLVFNYVITQKTLKHQQDLIKKEQLISSTLKSIEQFEQEVASCLAENTCITSLMAEINEGINKYSNIEEKLSLHVKKMNEHQLRISLLLGTLQHPLAIRIQDLIKTTGNIPNKNYNKEVNEIRTGILQLAIKHKMQLNEEIKK